MLPKHKDRFALAIEQFEEDVRELAARYLEIGQAGSPEEAWSMARHRVAEIRKATYVRVRELAGRAPMRFLPPPIPKEQ